jgi:hypothetical protein
MTDASDPSVFLLLTRRANEESFRAWQRSEAHHHSHGFMPRGLLLDPYFASITVGNRILDSAGAQNLGDALEGQTAALAEWLMDFDGMVALLLAPDGAIRARHRAGNRFFPPQPEKNFGSTIWDYLVSGAEDLRQRMSDPGARAEGSLLLSMTDAQQNPVTFEVGLAPARVRYFGWERQSDRYDAHFQVETLKLTSAICRR